MFTGKPKPIDWFTDKGVFNMNTKTKDMALIAVMTAVIAVLAPISLPIVGEVPISLATLAVMLGGVVLGSKKGAAAAALYLVLGAIGIPVFAGYSSGAGILFGMTGGYLFGYIPLAYISGLFYEKAKTNKTVAAFIGMIVGTVVLYILGTIWFIAVTKMNLAGAMMACVVPFLPGDLLKMVVVAAIAPQLAKVPALRNANAAA